VKGKERISGEKQRRVGARRRGNMPAIDKIYISEADENRPG
jgi:hypothetical protein